jgi:hypothetical protein
MVAMSSSTTNRPAPSLFLSLPIEIRLKIFELLFYCDQPLRLERPTRDTRENHDYPVSQEARLSPLQICRPAYLANSSIFADDAGLGLSGQLLCVKRQIYAEAAPVLYGINRFECAIPHFDPRVPSLTLPPGFALYLRHLILDWRHLDHLAKLLHGNATVQLTRNLLVLETNRFRSVMRQNTEAARMGITTSPRAARHEGSLNDYYENEERAYERLLLHAACDICQRHAQLRHVLQTTVPKSLPRGYEIVAGSGGLASRPIPELKVVKQVRWRFVTEKGLDRLRENEALLDVASELAAITFTG